MKKTLMTTGLAGIIFASASPLNAGVLNMTGDKVLNTSEYVETTNQDIRNKNLTDITEEHMIYDGCIGNDYIRAYFLNKNGSTQYNLLIQGDEVRQIITNNSPEEGYDVDKYVRESVTDGETLTHIEFDKIPPNLINKIPTLSLVYSSALDIYAEMEGKINSQFSTKNYENSSQCHQ